MSAEVEDVSKTAKMEELHLSFIPPVDGRGFTAVEECGQNNCSVNFDFGFL